MFVELHLLQNFAPSNLNRDDTGAPKDCDFGGYRRARISSQCIKRAIREQFKKNLSQPKEKRLLTEDDLASRTKRIVEKVAHVLKDREEGQVEQVCAALLAGIELSVGEGKTEYLLFLGHHEIAAVASLVEENWDRLVKVAAEHAKRKRENEAAKKKKSPKEMKKVLKEVVPNDLRKVLGEALDGGHAADLALFGRMLADLPNKNIDGACQVAHALSTNKVNMEMDYYTAVDDLKPDDTQGADMIGSVEFNSSCFYRYANINSYQLERNLLGKDPEKATDEEKQEAKRLARATIEAFLRAAVEAIPTGKQHSMAAQNPPSCIFAVVRDRGLWSLANAFVQPVRPAAGKSLVQNSIEALDLYWGKLLEAYSDQGIRAAPVCLVGDAELNYLQKNKRPTLEGLVQRVMEEVGR